MNRQEEQNDVERWQGVLDVQMEKSSKKLATLGAPTMEEEKKAAKDYDGDGKIESGKDEYFGSKDKAIKKAMGKKVKKEGLSNWRNDLSNLIEVAPMTDVEMEKEVKEKKVNTNEITIQIENACSGKVLFILRFIYFYFVFHIVSLFIVVFGLTAFFQLLT